MAGCGIWDGMQHCFMKLSTPEESFINMNQDRKQLAAIFAEANAGRKPHNDPESLTRFEFVEALIQWASFKFGECTYCVPQWLLRHTACWRAVATAVWSHVSGWWCLMCGPSALPPRLPCCGDACGSFAGPVRHYYSAVSFFFSSLSIHGRLASPQRHVTVHGCRAHVGRPRHSVRQVPADGRCSTRAGIEGRGGSARCCSVALKPVVYVG